MCWSCFSLDTLHILSREVGQEGAVDVGELDVGVCNVLGLSNGMGERCDTSGVCDCWEVWQRVR